MIDSNSMILVDAHDGVLFDLDGVVYRGTQAVPEAIDAIKQIPTPVAYVTNNASRSPDAVSSHLNSFGLNSSVGQIMTSAMAVAGLVVDLYGSGVKVLKVGGAGLEEALANSGAILVSSAGDNPQVVVQGTSTELTWHDLAEAVYAINAGADHIASNLDATMPTERGMALGNGALVEAVTHATGVSLRGSAGKPEAEIFHQAAKANKLASPLIVGDRLDTDIRGARAAGYNSAVVLTGVAQPRDIVNASAAERPDYIIDTLADLHFIYEVPTHGGNEWICGNDHAAVANGELYVTVDGHMVQVGEDPISVTMDGLKALCAAAWNAPRPCTVSTLIHIKG